MASQHITELSLFLAQRVFDVFLAQVVTAGLGKALTGTAGAIAAVQRNVDTLAVSGICHGFVSGGVNEAGDPVLKIQSDFVHDAPRE
ncbi:hypothetical protein D3C87_2015880 [compost metagenome]